MDIILTASTSTLSSIHLDTTADPNDLAGFIDDPSTGAYTYAHKNNAI